MERGKVEGRVHLEQCREGTLMLLMALVDLTVVALPVSSDAIFSGGAPPKECGSCGSCLVRSPHLATESDRASTSLSTPHQHSGRRLLSAQTWPTYSSFTPLLNRAGSRPGWAPYRGHRWKRPNQCGRSFEQALSCMTQAQNQKQSEKPRLLVRPHSKVSSFLPVTHGQLCTPHRAKFPPNLKSDSGPRAADPCMSNIKTCPL